MWQEDLQAPGREQIECTTVISQTRRSDRHSQMRAAGDLQDQRCSYQIRVAMCADIETGRSSPGESEEPGVMSVQTNLRLQYPDSYIHRSPVLPRPVASLMEKRILSVAVAHPR